MPLPHGWDVAHDAVWKEYAPGQNRVISLRHPTYPFDGPDAGNLPDDTSSTLIDFAASYLRKVQDVFGLTTAAGVPDILESASSDFVATVRLAWLDVHPADATPAPPLTSFWVSRYADPVNDPGDGAQPMDRTAVILAVQSATPNDETQALGSRLGIRIVVHVEPGTTGPFRARITSAACSIGLAPALALQAPVAFAYLERFFGPTPLRRALKHDVREAAGFGADRDVFIDGMRVIGVSGTETLVETFMTIGARGEQEPAYAVAAELAVMSDGRSEVRKVQRWPLVAHNVAPRPVRVRVFPRDPASTAGLANLVDGRPNRDPDRLRPYRRRRTLTGVTLGNFFDVVLADDLGEVEVRQSPLVDDTANPAMAETIWPGCILHPRTNWFAALSGYQNARGVRSPGRPGLFDSLRLYGLSAVQYFRFAALPLRIRHRAAMLRGPGRDGRIVNAEVRFEGLDGDLIASAATAPPLPINVKFALADVQRSSSRREPLGLATDARWSWHEYGHVLLAASTGALQFRFAHSAGDALAAIRSDPDSALATDPRMRGLTFPWVHLSRRHDRDVACGWSWSGRYHRVTRLTTDVNSYPKKGYDSEQILSSSLFRLYRALGGDTVDGGVPDVPARRRAADYTEYLIMKAIKLMSPAFIAPLETPDEFVSALSDADIGTLPAASGPLRRRVGGCAHKIVRWAFEAQGLYTGVAPLAVADRPGLPPDPDIFIDDARPDAEGGVPRGGYMPVSLDWTTAAWHASAAAITVAGNQVTVHVRNRGVSPANGVTVQIWWRVAPNPAQIPRWNKATWNSLVPSMAQNVPAWPAPAVAFGPFALPNQPAGTRVLIVAEATCPDDSANTIAATGLPCAQLATPLVDVVNGDNNLGLRVHVF